MTSKAQSRREFCTNACRAASLAALSGALAAALPGCGDTGGPTSPGSFGNISSLPTIAGTETNGSVVLGIGADSPLATVGEAALVQTQNRFLLVARVASEDFTALTATCTHQTCTVSGYSGETYVCPCHGSRFDWNGQVLSGPAPRPLRQYTTSFANDALTISL